MREINLILSSNLLFILPLDNESVPINLLCFSFTYWKSLPNFCSNQWYVSQSAPMKDGTSSTFECYLLSTKMWSIWFSLQLQASPINNKCMDSNQYTLFSSVNDPKYGVRINQHLASKSGRKGFYTPVTVYCCDFKSFTNRCAEASDTQFARVNRHQDF
jgi:hypothetical protein